MNQLLEIRKNIYYTKKESSSEEYNRVHEIVLILDEPKYKQTNEGNIVRERGCKEVRFTIPSDEMFDEVLTVLTKIKEAKEENLS
jgi:hypothetical protein